MDHFAKNCPNKAKVIKLDTLAGEKPTLEGSVDEEPKDEVAKNELLLEQQDVEEHQFENDGGRGRLSCISLYNQSR